MTEEAVKDNGVETHRAFFIDGKLDDGKPLPRAEVTAAQFSSMNWVVANWGVKARLAAGQNSKDRLREAIQYISGADVRERTLYVHTGWRETPAGWIYLHAGGAIGALGIETDLERPLDRYLLPDAPADVCGAVKQSLALLDVAPLTVTYPLLCSVALAPLCEVLHPDFCLWLHGLTGSMKSTLAALFLSHFGAFDRTSLPGSWESTGNAIEKTLFTLKDTLAVIDDYAPQADTSAQNRLMRAVAQVIRSQGNLSGRSRMRSDTSLRPSYPPRGLLVSTGEDVRSAQSLLARMLTVEVSRDGVVTPKLTEAQEKAHRLPHAMAGYIRWIAPKMEQLKVDLPRRWRENRKDALGEIVHLRTPEILAYLLTAWDLYLEFAQSVDAVTSSEADRYSSDAWGALVEVARKHSQRVKQVDPAERFLSVLSSLMASEAVYLDSKDMPRHPEDPKPAGDMIGWGDDDYLYLLPDPTRRSVVKMLRESGDHFPHSPHSLYRALEKRGALVRGTEGKSLSQVKIQSKKRRVIRIPRAALEATDDE